MPAAENWFQIHNLHTPKYIEKAKKKKKNPSNNTNFSRPKQSFVQCDNADCKQYGTKWSAEGAEEVPSQPATRKPCRSLLISPCHRPIVCSFVILLVRFYSIGLKTITDTEHIDPI